MRLRLESGQRVAHKKASELLANLNIARLFSGGGHVPGATAPVTDTHPLQAGFDGSHVFALNRIGP